VIIYEHCRCFPDGGQTFTMIAALYKRVRRVRPVQKKETVITLTQDSLIINAGDKPLSFTLSEIKDAYVKSTGDSSYLVILTATRLEMIDAAWLDIAPYQVIRSIYQFKLAIEKSWFHHLHKCSLPS